VAQDIGMKAVNFRRRVKPNGAIAPARDYSTNANQCSARQRVHHLSHTSRYIHTTVNQVLDHRSPHDDVPAQATPRRLALRGV